MGKTLRMLLIDTCGAEARVALSVGQRVLAQVMLARGGGSAEIVDAIAGLLQQSGWQMSALDAVGVVSGPGSFTGVRVGMATAKGLCEATGIRMVAVSRLVVLAEAQGVRDGLVVLDAGRGELYVGERSVDGVWREWLGSLDAATEAGKGREMVVAEAKVAELIAGAEPVMRAIEITDVLRTVLRELELGVGDMALADANYVRRESDIYAKPAGGR